jgi:hypothetical protein
LRTVYFTVIEIGSEITGGWWGVCRQMFSDIQAVFLREISRSRLLLGLWTLRTL